MRPVDRAPNFVPRGSIRLSDAYVALWRKLESEWSELEQRCVQWDESAGCVPDDGMEDPYPKLAESSYDAEMTLRTALKSGRLRAYIHNIKTGIDLELSACEWGRSGEVVGIHSDYTDERTPGPDCRLDGVLQPIFLVRDEFDPWLDAVENRATPPQSGALEGSELPQSTRAFSVEEVMDRTGLSKTKLYEEIARKNLVAKKLGVRTLILEAELGRFLRQLPEI